MMGRLLNSHNICAGIVKLKWNYTTSSEYDQGARAAIRKALRIIRDEPEVDADPTVHAHWEWDDDKKCLRCSACKADKAIGWKYPFCPWCAAAMDEEVNDEMD